MSPCLSSVGPGSVPRFARPRITLRISYITRVTAAPRRPAPQDAIDENKLWIAGPLSAPRSLFGRGDSFPSWERMPRSVKRLSWFVVTLELRHARQRAIEEKFALALVLGELCRAFEFGAGFVKTAELPHQLAAHAWQQVVGR